MLVVKVEIWPGGSRDDKYEVGRLWAANISNCAPVSSYEIRLADRQGFAGRMPTVEFQVDGHHRSDGFWPLVHKALTQAIEKGLVPPSSRT